MEKLILFQNNDNNYCGFDRNYSIWNTKTDNSLCIIDDYCIDIHHLDNLVSSYKKKNLDKGKILCISETEFYNTDFELIGFDCGYFYDKLNDFYVGFSTICNEIIRLNNEFCNLYKSYLNKFLLFSNFDDAYFYGVDRAKQITNDNCFFLENAYEDFIIMYIYLYKNGN